ncbi:uncharacterized protein [Chanodichthys erythropterus]|uniref:uncharacterized protein n=1 Tax=Chanodichthys erythropterus TaxID=933992 RepID=UPI00351F1E3B
MEAADLLCDSLFRWLENRKECADKLLELAQKLEKVHLGSNIAQGIGAAASVAAIISGASAAGVLTEGLALPLLVVTAEGGTAGATVSIASPLVEAGISRKTIKRVNKFIEEDEKVGKSIQKQLQDLKDQCGGAKLGAHADDQCGGAKLGAHADDQCGGAKLGAHADDQCGGAKLGAHADDQCGGAKLGAHADDQCGGAKLGAHADDQCGGAKLGAHADDQCGGAKLGAHADDQCGGAKLGAHADDQCGGAKLGDHADKLECEVVTQLMCALARRDNTHVPLDFLRGFDRATFFHHMTPGGLAPAKASRFIGQSLNLDRVPVIKSSLKVLDAIGLDRSLSNLIVTCEEMVKRKRVTEASKFLRDSARDILEGQQELKEQLDAMHEIIQKLFRLKNLIKDLGGYSLSLTEHAQNVITHIIKTYTDPRVLSWLQGIPHQIEFVNLLRFVMENFGPIIEDLTRSGGVHKDIVIVAHGSIVDQFMPAVGLVPLPNITDTILYSPWNCSIDAYAAFGIARGLIDMTNRQFYNMRNRVYCDPYPLPQHWNSMRESLHNIPGILLSPLTPEDNAWICFNHLLNSGVLFRERRVIIPYLVPQDQVKAFGEIPLFILIFATSIILMIFGKTATVHLAACLGHAGSPEEWRTQYAYTLSDPVCMTMSMNDIRPITSRLLDALRSMFDRNHS